MSFSAANCVICRRTGAGLSISVASVWLGSRCGSFHRQLLWISVFLIGFDFGIPDGFVRVVQSVGGRILARPVWSPRFRGEAAGSFPRWPVLRFPEL